MQLLEKQELTTIGLPACPTPHADGLLPQLDIDLDFAINAACREGAFRALNEKRAWLDNPESIQQIAGNLKAIGFEYKAVEQLLETSGLANLWVLEVEAK